MSYAIQELQVWLIGSIGVSAARSLNLRSLKLEVRCRRHSPGSRSSKKGLIALITILKVSQITNALVHDPCGNTQERQASNLTRLLSKCVHSTVVQ